MDILYYHKKLLKIIIYISYSDKFISYISEDTIYDANNAYLCFFFRIDFQK